MYGRYAVVQGLYVVFCVLWGLWSANRLNKDFNLQAVNTHQGLLCVWVLCNNNVLSISCVLVVNTAIPPHQWAPRSRQSTQTQHAWLVVSRFQLLLNRSIKKSVEWQIYHHKYIKVKILIDERTIKCWCCTTHINSPLLYCMWLVWKPGSESLSENTSNYVANHLPVYLYLHNNVNLAHCST